MPRTSLIAGLSVPESAIACAIAAALYSGTSAAQDAPPTQTPPPAEAAPVAPTPPPKPAKKAPAKAKPAAAPATPPPAAAVPAPPPPAAAVPAPPPPAAASSAPSPGTPPPPAAADANQAPPGLSAPTEPPPGYGPSAPSGYNPPGYMPPPPPGEPPPPPGEPPYARRYGRLGGDPEGPPEPGSWDPWAHPMPGRFSHEGFFMRLNLGPSIANVWRPDYRWTGLGLGMGLSVGGSLIENLALHADFNTTLVSNPTEHAHGRKYDLNGDIVFESMGLGLTYYIMPVNIYVSGSVGVGVLVFEDDDGASKDTSAGLTLGASVGKEWWVGSDWGLGVAAQLQYIRVKDFVDDARMNGLAVNVVFSATYN